MRIAIIGAGAVGGGIGLAWLKTGHDVRWGVRDAAPGRYPVLPGERLLEPSAAIEGAEAILLATPWPATEEAVRGLGDLAGRIVIDATNPLRMGEGGLELALGFDTSGGELVAEWAGGARVYKALNQTGAENLGDAGRYANKPAMFVAGDEPEGKAVVMRLVGDLGFASFDGGPLRNARLLEAYAMLWIDQAYAQGRGRDFAMMLEHPAR
ncbi:NADPH-dependent F420 reductase [Erythrobacter sp. NE805]|uniref:NADPH-dependent F420 reductase n=1 Tax=Erythrobacter sp. NE805 TaxID=3389875 RepID=UPI00396B235F